MKDGEETGFGRSLKKPGVKIQKRKTTPEAASGRIRGAKVKTLATGVVQVVKDQKGDETPSKKSADSSRSSGL